MSPALRQCQAVADLNHGCEARCADEDKAPIRSIIPHVLVFCTGFCVIYCALCIAAMQILETLASIRAKFMFFLSVFLSDL